MTVDSNSVAILLVLYKSEKNLSLLLTSLKNQTCKQFNIYAISNDGNNESFSLIQNYFPNSIILSNSENIGFAKANNLLAKKAIEEESKYLFVLNPDMELSENTLSELEVIMESDKNIFACSSVLLFGGKEKETIQLFGQKINFKTQKKTLLYANQLLRNTKLPEYLQVDFVNGGSLFIRSETIKQIGLFEEDYFMYNDETDLAYRIKQNGGKVMVTSKTKIYHHHDWSHKNIIGYKFMYYYMMRNKYIYYKKYNLYFNLLVDLIFQIILLPIKLKWFHKLSGISITKYYYLGIIKGIIGETGKTKEIFN